jgi:RNA polymerase sigma-70 factor (ECF subfamily)
MNDADLIRESLVRPEAFAALYDRHAAALHRFAARRLGRQAADDIVADTFLTAFRLRERYQLDRPDARPWLYGIAVRLIGRRRRAEARMWRAVARSTPAARADHDLDRSDDRLAARAVQGPLASAVAGLSSRDRDVLLLVAWAEFSYDEVAAALEIPVGTVRSRLNRARRQLRAALGDLEATPSSLTGAVS